MKLLSAKPRPSLPQGPFLVVGLARSGQAVARLLAARGERVIGCDAGRPDQLEGLRGIGVEVHTDTDGVELLEAVGTVVKSPGVPTGSAVITAARDRGIEVTGELEIAWRLSREPFIAVTGTNGKTTTTELIRYILDTAGYEAVVAGNIGSALSDVVADHGPGGERVIVCECSSFQLEDTSAFSPECAVLLNLSPDHLDRHGDFDSYRRAKLAIFANQAETDLAVLNGDDRHSPEATVARQVRFCAEGCDVSRSGTEILWRGAPLINASELQLIGAHNEENAMAAAAATLALGIDRDAVARGLVGFTGVAHRLEPVAEIGGVLYVNDSKATNVAAAKTALSSFGGRVHAILGGSLKGEPFDDLVEPIAANCAACYLIGPAAETLEPLLRRRLPEATARLRRGEHDRVGIHHCADLAAAVTAAARAATPGEVVLLSPACASFDAFRDFEDRGDHFRRLVEDLR